MAAFEQLVRRYDKKVLSIAFLYTRNDEDAKDIYQEVFLRVYRGLSGFQFRSLFSTWLYKIVTNVCLSHQMKGRRVEHVPLEGASEGTATGWTGYGASPEKLCQDAEITMHVNKALAALSPQQRLVFILKHYQDLKLSEVADMMDCAEGTVKRYLYTATRKLRAQLKDVFEL